VQILKKRLPQSRMLNAKHVFAKRFIVVDEVADEFIALFANKINLLKRDQ
jgi:hypothetical protein